MEHLAAIDLGVKFHYARAPLGPGHVRSTERVMARAVYCSAALLLTTRLQVLTADVTLRAGQADRDRVFLTGLSPLSPSLSLHTLLFVLRCIVWFVVGYFWLRFSSTERANKYIIHYTTFYRNDSVSFSFLKHISLFQYFFFLF